MGIVVVTTERVNGLEYLKTVSHCDWKDRESYALCHNLQIIGGNWKFESNKRRKGYSIGKDIGEGGKLFLSIIVF